MVNQALETSGLTRVKRALLSVSDKKEIGSFARNLRSMDIEILSTGGTAQVLKKEGIRIREISKLTGFPEILNGRVKTLHPSVYGGLLAVRGNEEHQEEIKKHNIQTIDLIAVNLYPFREVIKKGGTPDQAIENIDIGGPAMLRAAAKNHEHVAVAVSPNDYAEIIAVLERENGYLTPEMRTKLAKKAFQYTADYDKAIAKWFKSNYKIPSRSYYKEVIKNIGRANDQFRKKLHWVYPYMRTIRNQCALGGSVKASNFAKK